MLKVFKYLKWYHWLFMLLVVGLLYLQVRMDLILPEKIGDITETIIIGNTTGVSVTKDILDNGLIMLLVSFISISATIVASYFSTRVAARVASTLRHEIYHHVQDFSLAEINHFSTPSLITRTTNDIQQVQMAFIMMFRLIITAPIMAASAIVKVVNLNVTLTMVVVFAVAAIIFLILTIFSLVGKKFSLIQKQVDDLNQVTRETLTGIRVIRAHNAQDTQTDKFDGVNTRLTKTQLLCKFKKEWGELYNLLVL